MRNPKTVLVTGATGKQGGAVARSLLNRGHRVIALTRDEKSVAARALFSAGARLIQGDLGDPEAILARLQLDALYLMATPFEKGSQAEVAQATGMIDAAQAARIPHVVYSSVAGATRPTGVPHFDSKLQIERHLASTNLVWTVVAPVAFMDFLNPAVYLADLSRGVLAMGLPPSRKLQYVSVEDIGQVVVALIERGPNDANARYELAGDEASGSQVARTLSQASGRAIRYVSKSPSDYATVSPDLAAMFEWLNAVGYDADRSRLAKAFPGLQWQSLSDWAARQDWRAALRADPTAEGREER